MNKRKILAALGAFVGFWVSIYGLVGLAAIAPAAPPEKRAVHYGFWSLVSAVALALTLASAAYLALAARRRQRRLAVDHLAALRGFHEERVRPRFGLARGALAAEIDDLEKYFGAELPLAYRRYLEFMGRDYSGVLGDARCFIGDAAPNSARLAELRPAGGARRVAFFADEEMLAWFELPAAADDPPVFVCDAARGAARPADAVLTGFILRKMEESLARANDEG